MRTPGPFFHGSIHADLQPGDRILPASQAGVENWTSYYDTGGGDWRRDSVFMVGPYGKAGQEAGGTDDPARMEQSAWEWAEMGVGEHSREQTTAKRATVYEVEPDEDAGQPDDAFNEWTASGATVKRRIDIPQRLTTPGGYGSQLAHVTPGKQVQRVQRVWDKDAPDYSPMNPRKIGNDIVQGTLPPIAWQQFGPLEEDPEDGPAYEPPKPRDDGPHFRPASAIPYQGQQEMFPR